MVRVSDLMSGDPVVIPPSQSPAACAMTMREHNLRHLIVATDEGILGQVTDARIFALGGFMASEPPAWVYFVDAPPSDISTLTRPCAIIVREDDPFWLVLSRWVASRQDAVFVVDGAGQPKGILTEHDIVRLAADSERLTQHKVDTIATLYPAVVTPEDTVARALQLMDHHGCRHMIVVEGQKPVAAVSLRDLVVSRTKVHSEDPVSGCMSTGLFTVESGTTIADAAKLMRDHKVGSLPLMEGDALRGVVTRRDLMEIAADALELTSRPESAMRA